MLYYLMGKSASGKDSIFHKLLEKTKWKSLIPYTTRPMRDGEVEGQEYHFISTNQFKSNIDRGIMAEFREYDTVFGKWYYGTILPADRTKEGKGKKESYLAIGTLESYLQLKQKLGPENICPIYIEVPDELRLERAFHREEGRGNMTREEILRRFKADDEDFSEEKLKEAGVERRYLNLDISSCLNEILSELYKADKSAESD